MTNYKTGMLKTTLGGRYSIISRLGAGGFGETYLAEDTQLPDHHCCVVKHLKPQSDDPEILDISRRLFVSEAKVLHKLGSHDQIPRLLANFEENQEFYLVQEFIEGHGLDRELGAGQQWQEAEVIDFLKDVLAILSFVHAQKVIHRDLKPENLIRRQSDRRLVLIDFGAVKQIYTQVLVGRPKSTITIGTSGYMPSEQANGHPQTNSDIYALGIIAIQALTGLDPEYLPHNPHTLELEWSGLCNASGELIEILDRMVRFDFRQRYTSAAAVLEDLAAISVQAIPSAVVTAIEVNNTVNNTSTEILPATQIEIEKPSSPPTETSRSAAWLLIAGAIAIVLGVGGFAASRIYLATPVKLPEPTVSAPPEPNPSQQAADEVKLFTQLESKIQEKIKTNGELAEIEAIATQLPATSPLRRRLNPILDQYRQAWNQDRSAANAANAAYRQQNWQKALNAQSKITTPYWKKRTAWIARAASGAIARANRPRVVRKIDLPPPLKCRLE